MSRYLSPAARNFASITVGSRFDHWTQANHPVSMLDLIDEQIRREVTMNAYLIEDEMPFYVTYYVEEHGDDYMGGYSKCSSVMTAREMLLDMLDNCDDPSELVGIRSTADVRSSYSNYLDCLDCRGIDIETEEEHAKREMEERRAELEGAARSFAQDCGFALGTTDFINALVDSIESARDTYNNYNSYESRMEEWMDHRYAGSTEYYYENVDYTSSKLRDKVDTLEDILAWLNEYCPLLMAQVMESRLKNK